MKKRLIVPLVALVSFPVWGQESPDTCIDRHPNGGEVWGCYDGEPYWDIAEFGGERPMVSGGTLYVPSKRKKEPGMTDRIIDRAVRNTKWQFESRVNNEVDKNIYKVMEKIF